MQQIVAQLLAQLQASEQDKFAAHLYQSRRQHRRACERPDKATRLSSARLSQATKSRRAWASPATFAPGNTCSTLSPRRPLRPSGTHSLSPTEDASARREPAKSGNLENAWGSTTTLAEHPSTITHQPSFALLPSVFSVSSVVSHPVLPAAGLEPAHPSRDKGF